MNYGIVIFPSKEIQDRANNLRKRYDSHYFFIPPHITLKDSFECENIEEAAKFIDEVTNRIPPFTLKVNKTKTFLPTSPVVYFGLEENADIDKLHNEINSNMLKHDKQFNFIPHITIAQELPEQELHDIYNRLRMKDFTTSFLVDRIHLLYQIESGSWTNYQTFLLRGKE